MHVPVLLKEVISCLDPKPDENFIDCTFGQGGHAKAILEKTAPNGKLLGIERDQEILTDTRYKILDTEYKNRLILVNENFANLKSIIEKERFRQVSGILLDLGISSWHLQESNRGFSFLKNEPLMMNLDDKGQTAKEILNSWAKEDLERIFREYGQERFAKRIAERICLARRAKPIETTLQLAEIIKRSVPSNYERGRINPATRIFLALRIAVNQELENLRKTLPQTLEVLEKNGKVLVISFNSLEDGLVKRFFKEKEKQGIIKILTKKPIVAGQEELKINPRSRSAKLRAAQKL
jgi:16S rRNA (cytosine1402-N4)-methyltransferase